MLYGGKLETGMITPDGALLDRIELCRECPRRAGRDKVRAPGILGLLGKTVETTVHDRPLKSGQLHSYRTNGHHGVFYGNGGENSGTVSGLRTDNVVGFVERISICDGPDDNSNTCRALGKRSLWAIRSLDDALKVSYELELAGESAYCELPPIRVYLNHSRGAGALRN